MQHLRNSRNSLKISFIVSKATNFLKVKDHKHLALRIKSRATSSRHYVMISCSTSGNNSPNKRRHIQENSMPEKVAALISEWRMGSTILSIVHSVLLRVFYSFLLDKEDPLPTANLQNVNRQGRNLTPPVIYALAICILASSP